MTATILVLLALVAIVVIARITKDANLGSSLIIAFALSIAVGLGIKNYASKQSMDLNAKIENVSTNQIPMPLYYPEVTQDSISLAGVASKETNWFVTNSPKAPTCVQLILPMSRGSTKPIDSS